MKSLKSGKFLENFKKYLDNLELRNETKRIYFSKVKTVLENQNINSIDDININAVVDSLKGQNKNYISQTKNALKLLYRSNDEFLFSSELEELQEKAPKQRKKPEKTLKLSKLNRKINVIRNKKMKLAFRLEEISGLRIGEIANLRKDDIQFCENNRFIVFVRDGKGGKQRRLKTLDDKYLYDELKKFIDQSKTDKLFYSDRHMQKKAKELEFHTHDLRKVNTHILFDKLKMDKESSLDIVRKVLGHEPKSKTVFKYLGRDIDKSGTKYY